MILTRLPELCPNVTSPRTGWFPCYASGAACTSSCITTSWSQLKFINSTACCFPSALSARIEAIVLFVIARGWAQCLPYRTLTTCRINCGLLQPGYPENMQSIPSTHWNYLKRLKTYPCPSLTPEKLFSIGLVSVWAWVPARFPQVLRSCHK